MAESDKGQARRDPLAGVMDDRHDVIFREAGREFLGTISSGADDDIRQATSLARAMVSRWGMSSEVGPVDLRASEEHPFLGREMAQPRRYSEHSAQVVDEAVRELLLAADEQATTVITGHRAAVERLVEELEENETLEREAIEHCLHEPALPRSRARSARTVAKQEPPPSPMGRVKSNSDE